jgi:hypothetical protein
MMVSTLDDEVPADVLEEINRQPGIDRAYSVVT